MPLVEPVPLLPIDQLGPVHFIAIGGAGMSGIALMYAESGVKVSGSDQSDGPLLPQLREAGIEVYVGHDPANLGDAQTVVVSSAIKADNVELVEAKRRGLRIWHRSAALAALMLGKDAVSVSGTHGKTTTSAMIAYLLDSVDAKPSYVLGARIAGGASAKLGEGKAFVIEADESDGSFLQYPTKYAVITNIDQDHLDNWGTVENYREGYHRFASADGVEAVIISADDPGARAEAERLKTEGKKVITFGESAQADYRLSEITLDASGSSALISHGEFSARFGLRQPGRHNVLDFAAAFAAADLLGCDPVSLAAAAPGFTAAERRFQVLGKAAGVTVVDDYAHHPDEVRATLLAAREYAGKGRVIACFQPHLFSRTQRYAAEFAQALALADIIVLTDIYPAREAPIPGVTGKLIADEADKLGRPVEYVAKESDLPKALAEIAASGDLVLTIGAGSITRVGPELLALLRGR